ncbi:hypothetical protein C2G38_2116394 [Gigaspora rosea]|uniref:Uncharacterized protein n=1 Tax=Gigaspora rosea TaxID=44941 RepID=A0A397UGN2_9GLOM|nr:hypothetical protein C2G38_2116394 [Gigaspora rosea]
MSFPHLWTPSLEPRTVVHSWYRHAMVNEAVALDKEEEEYEAQLQAIKNKCKRTPIPGVYRFKSGESYSDDEIVATDDIADDDSEYDDGEEEEDEEDEDEDLDDELEDYDEGEDDVEEEIEDEGAYSDTDGRLILLTQPLTEEQPSDFLSPERDPTRDIESSELAVFQAMGAEDYSRGFLGGLDDIPS